MCLPSRSGKHLNSRIVQEKTKDSFGEQNCYHSSMKQVVHNWRVGNELDHKYSRLCMDEEDKAW